MNSVTERLKVTCWMHNGLVFLKCIYNLTKSHKQMQWWNILKNLDSGTVT